MRRTISSARKNDLEASRTILQMGHVFSVNRLKWGFYRQRPKLSL